VVLQPQDVEPVVGRDGSVGLAELRDDQRPDQVVRDFSYRVEAGSTRKPNKQQKIAQLTELAQYGRFADFALQGQVGPWNAFMHDWCRNADIDPGPYQLQPPQGPSPQEQEMQAEMQMKVQELNVKVAEMQAKLQMEQQSQEQELEHERTCTNWTLSDGRIRVSSNCPSQCVERPRRD
jgi:hypothetical protein